MPDAAGAGATPAHAEPAKTAAAAGAAGADPIEVSDDEAAAAPPQAVAGAPLWMQRGGMHAGWCAAALRAAMTEGLFKYSCPRAGWEVFGLALCSGARALTGAHVPRAAPRKRKGKAKAAPAPANVKATGLTAGRKAAAAKGKGAAAAEAPAPTATAGDEAGEVPNPCLLFTASRLWRTARL